MKQKVLEKLRQKTSGDGSSNLYIDLEKLIGPAGGCTNIALAAPVLARFSH